MLCTTSVGPEISNNILEQPIHGRGSHRIAGVSAHAVRLLKILQDRFVRIPGRDPDTHAVLREQSGATGADAGAAPNDQCDVLHERLTVDFRIESCSVLLCVFKEISQRQVSIGVIQ